MKLSVWSSYFADLSPEDAIVILARHGYRYCELSDEHALVLLDRGDPTEIGKQFSEFANAHDIKITQGHLFLHANVCNPEHRALLMQQIDLFSAIGIQNAVLHCDLMRNEATPPTDEVRRARNLEALTELVNYIGERDLCICLENLRIVFTSSEDLLYYVERINSPHLGICLDTGHLNLSKAQTQREFILRAGKHLRALHIADNEGGTDQHILPFGVGNVPLGEVLGTLREIGYDGLYNLEIPGERKAPLEILELKLDYIQKMFAYLETLAT